MLVPSLSHETVLLMQALRSDTPGPMRGSVMRLDTQYRSVYQITSVGYTWVYLMVDLR